MDASVVGDLLARDRRSPDPALVDVAADRRRSYRDVCTTAYKAGNVLRYLGVDAGDVVAVAADPVPQTVLTFLGATLLGARTRFDAFASPADAGGEARVVVVPAERAGAFAVPPGTALVVYGGSPSDPAATHWEETVWSENPAFPPTPVDPDSTVLVDGRGNHAHAAVLDAARAVVDEFGLDADDGVAIRGSLADARVATAGVVAPLLVGGRIVLPADETTTDGTDTDATLAVGSGPEPRTCDPDDVPL